MAATQRQQGKVQRGMVTAVGTAERDGRVVPPVILRRRAEPEPGPSETFRYVTNQARFLLVKIVTLSGLDDAALRAKREEDPRYEPSADEALTLAALAHEPEGYIRFIDYAYATPHRSVRDWLDDRIKRGRIRGMDRDSAQMRLGCVHRDPEGAPCRFQVFNTPAGLREMQRHVLEEHSDDDEWGSAAADEPGESPDEDTDEGDGS